MAPSASCIPPACPVTLDILRRSVNISMNPDWTAEEIAENIESAENTAPLTPEEEAGIAEVRRQLGTQFCRRCNYCAPCTVGINIPGVFLFEGYLMRYGLEEWARSRYATNAVKASACIECGVCETRCPYNLPIREMLKKAAAEFGE